MALHPFLANEPLDLKKLSLTQVITMAGDGKLKDGSECSSQFRDYLRYAPSDLLFRYVNNCLDSAFEKSGLALQDLVNELGRRLDYDVDNGWYQGTVAQSGHDGLWKLSDDSSIVVEVKTSDAYRVNLDRIAEYREDLVSRGSIAGKSSILIVVGRQDTGDLEAQVRGSRHAWTIRLISADALIRLVKLKEKAESSTIGKIHGILKPIEYTRVDAIIDITFTAVEEAYEEAADEGDQVLVEPHASTSGPRTQEHSHSIEEVRGRIIEYLAGTGKVVIRKSRATYWSVDKSYRAAITVSKCYPAGNYWYAYHVMWDAFLAEAKESYFILGCLDRDTAFALPVEWMRDKLPSLNTSDEGTNMFWHIHLNPNPSGSLSLRVAGQDIDLAPFSFSISPSPPIAN